MIKIGDFSRLAQVSVRTLRLYDEMGLLKPAHIDRFSDYRYYNIEQLPRLNRILVLKDLGFSLEQIARMLKDNVPLDQMKGMLVMKQAEAEREVAEAQARLARVAARLQQIENEGKAPAYDVMLKQVEPMTIASIRQIVPSVEDFGPHCIEQYRELYDWLDDHDIAFTGHEIALYHNTEYTEVDIDYEAATPIKPQDARNSTPSSMVVIRDLPAVPLMASIVHHGCFRDVTRVIQGLFTWMALNRYTVAGPLREIHLSEREPEISLAERVVIELQAPVAPMR
jgi:DNA-binding transcriptional MerR regulator